MKKILYLFIILVFTYSCEEKESLINEPNVPNDTIKKVVNQKVVAFNFKNIKGLLAKSTKTKSGMSTSVLYTINGDSTISISGLNADGDVILDGIKFTNISFITEVTPNLIYLTGNVSLKINDSTYKNEAAKYLIKKDNGRFVKNVNINTTYFSPSNYYQNFNIQYSDKNTFYYNEPAIDGQSFKLHKVNFKNDSTVTNDLITIPVTMFVNNVTPKLFAVDSLNNIVIFGTGMDNKYFMYSDINKTIIVDTIPNVKVETQGECLIRNMWFGTDNKLYYTVLVPTAQNSYYLLYKSNFDGITSIKNNFTVLDSISTNILSGNDNIVSPNYTYISKNSDKGIITFIHRNPQSNILPTVINEKTGKIEKYTSWKLVYEIQPDLFTYNKDYTVISDGVNVEVISYTAVSNQSANTKSLLKSVKSTLTLPDIITKPSNFFDNISEIAISNENNLLTIHGIKNNIDVYYQVNMDDVSAQPIQIESDIAANFLTTW